MERDETTNNSEEGPGEDMVHAKGELPEKQHLQPQGHVMSDDKVSSRGIQLSLT